MTEEKKKQDRQKDKEAPVKPADTKKNTSQKKKTDTAKAEKKNSSQKPAFSQKEIDRLILEHADMQMKCKEYQENFLLLAAEFENYKKRIQKDQQRAREQYKESILAELLPVIDDVERALQHHAEDELAKGFTMIHTSLLALLERYEVVPFRSLGEEFDPEKHDAMLTRTLEEEKHNIILEEFQKGYMIGKKVLRHAKVIVNILE
jgi:molecular chaperone GrpE